MATTLRNQASITYQVGGVTETATSNEAQITVLAPLEIRKRALNTDYGADDSITYVVTVRNTGNVPLTGVTVTDNLGAYTATTGTATPLTAEGNADLYLADGTVTAITPTTSPTGGAVYTLGTLPANSNAFLVYRARTNGFAPLATDSEITNTVVLAADNIADQDTASATLPVRNTADITVVKTMSPDPVANGGTITYQIIAYNAGNTPAEGVVLTDVFETVPNITSVTVDGVPTTNYTLTGNTFTYPATGVPSVTVPAATISQDLNGQTRVVPGTLNVTITGTI